MSRCRPTCDPANEPLKSALDNFVAAFFGSVTKTCVNGQVVWALPCDLEEGVPGFPREEGEGIACYILRILQAGGFIPQAGFTGTQDVVTNMDFTSPDFTMTKQTFTYQDGLLLSISDPVITTVFTGEACP